ncbi:MAG TPA: AsmA family protein [Draconibacterium sp.]|nr:AsmA family protein [Draconibacterium sp.]HRX10322.1 AsmA family protein [Draconibacterium sp.]
MKKVILIIVIIIALIVGTLISIPLFFKQTILEKTKTAINNQLNAEVEFKDFKLSLFRNFPKITIEMQNVSITGKGEFQTDTLLSIETLQAKMNLKSLFKKSEKKIEEINLIEPKLNLIVGKTGNANWNVTAETAIDTQVADEKPVKQDDGFELQLEKIEIENAKVVYNDREINMLQVFEDVNLSVNGKMYGSSTELKGDGKVGNFSVKYDSVQYISNVSLETTTLLNVDYEKMDIRIIENELLVNRLPMQVTGLIQMPSDSMFFDLELKTKDSSFDNFLALIPPGYEDYLKKIKTSGSAAVSGTVNGLYFDENYPAFKLKIDVENGNLKYVDLPEEIKNIRADISIEKPQGDLDLTEVRVKNAHFEIKSNPVDMTLYLKNLVSDPFFDGALVGKVNFDQLKDALPLDSVNVSGTIDANLFAKGNYSSVEKEEYDKIKSDGTVLLDNFIYDSPDLTQKVLVPSGKLDFSPQNVNLSQLNMKVGQSDFSLTGKVSNYLNYIFKNGTLQGDLQMVSSFVNLNEILRLQKTKNAVSENKNVAEKQAENNPPSNEKNNVNTEKLAFDIPKNIDFTFHSNINKAVFDKLPISNIKGLITAKGGKLILNGLNMSMLEGELKLTGSYENTPLNQPFVDFGLDVVKFDIPNAYQSLSGFQKMMPIAGQSEGKLSTTLKMKGQLSQMFKLIPSSIDGTGFFNTENLRIIESPIFKELKGILLPEKLKNVDIEDFKANFIIENGNIDLKPFNTKVAGQETTVLGTLSAENLLNLRMDFKVNRNAIGSDIQNILSVIPGNEKITVLPAGVAISGPVGKPEVKVDLSETKKTVASAAKEGINDSLKKLGKGLQQLFEK